MTTPATEPISPLPGDGSSGEDLVVCADCGTANRPTAFFCYQCGIGLELLLAPEGDRLLNVRVGPLLRAATVGGFAAVVVQMLSLSLLSRLASADIPPFNKTYHLYARLSWFTTMPTLFLLGATLLLGWQARRQGIPRRTARLFGGGLWALTLAGVCALFSPGLGLLVLFLALPFLEMRLGLGFMTPWYPLRKLLGASATFVGLALLLAWTGSGGRVPFLERATPTALLHTEAGLVCATDTGHLFRLSWEDFPPAGEAAPTLHPWLSGATVAGERTGIRSISNGTGAGDLLLGLDNDSVWRYSDTQATRVLIAPGTLLQAFTCQGRLRVLTDLGTVYPADNSGEWLLATLTGSTVPLASLPSEHDQSILSYLKALPSDPCKFTVVPLLGIGFYTSRDGGMSFTSEKVPFLPHAVELSEDGQLMVGVDGEALHWGLRQGDGSWSWQRARHLRDKRSIYTGVALEADGQSALVGSSEGLHRFTLDGQSWEELPGAPREASHLLFTERGLVVAAPGTLALQDGTSWRRVRLPRAYSLW